MLDALKERAGALGRQAHAIVLSDYRKGVVTPPVIAAARDAAREAGVPLLVDPEVPQFERYQGVDSITPNHHEAELMTRVRIRTDDEAREAARVLHERTGASVLITRGEHGMWVLDKSAGRTIEESLPAAAREVADVTGAGDTVIAVLRSAWRPARAWSTPRASPTAPPASSSPASARSPSRPMS